jgi:hypothetical protein
MTGGVDYLLMRQIGVSLVLAVLVTVLFTPLLLLLYRRQVSAWMARKAGEAPPPPPLGQASRSALPPSGQLRQRSRAVVQARARAWFLGFAAQAAVLTLLFSARYAAVLSPTALLIAFGVFLLPAALVLFTVSTASGWTRLLAVGAVLVVLGLWPGLAGDLLREVALLYVGVPLLPLVLFHLRFWRGAAPLVFLLALIGFSGWVLAMGLGTGVLGMGLGPGLWLVRLLGLAAGLGVGMWLLRRVSVLHARGTVSDQGLALTCWWLLYTLVQALMVSIGLGIGEGAMALLSFALGLWIAGRAIGSPDGPETAPHRLLLLRVFGNNRRSERLIEQLVQAWSAVGSIELIGGADLALQQVSPLDFLAFLTGRLQDRFGQAPSEATARLATSPTRTPDGSYPSHQTFCHADAWEPTMRRLLDASDAVVMDLRQFQAERAGCRVELEALARSGSQRPLVLVTDASTDHPLLRRLLKGAGADPDQPPWHVVTASGREATTVGRVMDAVGGT